MFMTPKLCAHVYGKDERNILLGSHSLGCKTRDFFASSPSLWDGVQHSGHGGQQPFCGWFFALGNLMWRLSRAFLRCQCCHPDELVAWRIVMATWLQQALLFWSRLRQLFSSFAFVLALSSNIFNCFTQSKNFTLLYCLRSSFVINWNFSLCLNVWFCYISSLFSA